MSRERIINHHNFILEKLLAWKEQHPDLTFWLRKNEAADPSKNRLRQGYWFQGNDADYLFVGLSNQSGGTNMTRSIGWVMHYSRDGQIQTSLEVVWPGETNRDRIQLYQEIVRSIPDFQRINDVKYIKPLGSANSDAELEQLLVSFLNGDYLQLINLFGQHPEAEMKIPEQKFQSLLNKVQGIRNNKINKSEFGSKSINVRDSIFTEASLNTILYGPPGTGKTFNSINCALEIVLGADEYALNISKLARKELTTIFRDFLIEDIHDSSDEGQIAFVTFHQSMNYEDFVEGIKPVDPKHSQKDYLEYEVTAGIFKHISRLAATNPYTIIGDPVKSIISENDFDKKANFIKVDLRSSADNTGKVNLDYCIENKCISVFNEIDQNLSTIDTQGRPEQEAFVSKPIDETYVIVTLDDNTVKAIGRIIGPYEYHSGQAYRHTRAVIWLVKDAAIPVAEVFDPAYTEGIFCPLTRKKVKKEFFIKGSALAENKKVIPRNYVLIIDEINRGNIAQIFGELITLIEKDKRTGFDEELSVTLPYSKESFSVPPNLFIIGTMNTADRSVEALDTALRRRFVFKEMMPQESIIMESFKKEYLSLCEKHSTLIWNEDEWLTLESAYTDAIQQDERNQQIADFKKLVNELGAIRTYQDYVNCWNKAGVRLIIVDKLEVINRRIEVLLNRDHLIGHSYLIGKYTREAIYNTFYQNIIPLLKEYFYGDYGKIGLILGNHFVAKKEQEVTSILASFEYPGVEDFNEKYIYTIKDFKKADGSSDYDLFYHAFCNI